MTFTIKTYYADGTMEERDATPEEVAERDAQIAQIEQADREVQAQMEAKQAARQAGIQRLMELGLTEEQALAIAG
jgi:hypothetical protein